MPLLAHAGEGLLLSPETIRQDISDVLLSATGLFPPDYNLHPCTRHERRRNKALLRDWRPVFLPQTKMNEVSFVWAEERLNG